MISFLDNPDEGESKDYNNKGSVGRLANYLTSNEDKLDSNDLFFNYRSDNISREDFTTLIDNNVKGLTVKDHKFFSISINPSHDELEWIKNDKNKLKEFIKESVSNYAASFKTQGIMKEDLVWGAIIHDKRYYTDKDVYVYKKKNPEKANDLPFRAGQEKPGNQMHAHVIVSARNKAMDRNLTVLTATNKVSRGFELKGFQKRNQDTFQNMFYYKNGINIYQEAQQKIVCAKVLQLEKLGYQPQDFEIINKIGGEMEFNSKFTRNLNRLVQEAYKGNVIGNTAEYLTVGDKKYREIYPNGIEIGGLKAPIQELSNTKAWSDLDKFFHEMEKGVEVTTGKGESESRKRKRKNRNNNL